jgi:hypothetical protein
VPLWQGNRLVIPDSPLRLCSGSHSPVLILSIDKSIINTAPPLSSSADACLSNFPAMPLEGGCDNPQLVEQTSELPFSLLDLLSNSIIFDIVIPQLPLSSIFALSRTAKPYRSSIQQNPRFFRYLDLSRCRGAYVPPSLTRIDSGGHPWRSQRMDEHLTEDDIYSGPLRGVLSKLSKTVSLKAIHVLVLDGLASVTSDIVSELLMDNTYDVWMLSVVGCVNLNPRKLQQLLSYICRPSRPEGSPRLKGLYYFGTEKKSSREAPMSVGSMAYMELTSSEGAQLGGQPPPAQSILTSSDPWYAPTGRVLSDGFAQRSPWEETLQVCKGIIAFDAVLCTHMHREMAPFWHHASAEYLAEFKPAVAPLATVALGPNGCAGCGRAPQDAPVWGESDVKEFPLLSPPPLSGQIVDAVRPPRLAKSEQEACPKQRLIVSCTWCLTNRHCENCHRWWCGSCYNIKKSTKRQQLETFMDLTGLQYQPSGNELATETKAGKGSRIKVFNGLC